MKLRLSIIYALTFLFLSTIAQAAPLVITGPSLAILTKPSTVNVTWTGGNSSDLINVSIVDIAAWKAVGSVASNIPNSGSVSYTFPSTLPCKKKYQFYVEDIKKTQWVYGPVFILNCRNVVAGPVATLAPTPSPSQKCKHLIPVTNIHYPTQTCAASTPNFLANMMTMFHFKSKCPTGTQLIAVMNVSCQNAPIPGFSSGSVYAGSACCSVPLSEMYNTKDKYNAIHTAASVQIYAKNRADSECKTKHGPTSMSSYLSVTNITWNTALKETYDDRAFNCTL